MVLYAIEFVVITFCILYGSEYGFESWNWITIIACVGIDILILIGAIIYDNIGKKKASKEELMVEDIYKERAKEILNVLDDYLKENIKVSNDLKIYWPFYKGMLRRISNGKKLNGKDYDIIENVRIWQENNYEDNFLINVYEVIKSNII